MLTLIRCPFHTHAAAVARETFRQFYQKGRWPVTPKHPYTLDPTKSEWADYAAVQAQCGNLSGNELARKLSGNIRPQSAQLVEPLWTDPGLRSGISVHELTSTQKQKQKTKKRKRGINGKHSQYYRKRGKKQNQKTPTTITTICCNGASKNVTRVIIRMCSCHALANLYNCLVAMC